MGNDGQIRATGYRPDAIFDVRQNYAQRFQDNQDGACAPQRNVSISYVDLQQIQYNTIVPVQVRLLVAGLELDTEEFAQASSSLEAIYSNTLYYDYSGQYLPIAALRSEASADPFFMAYNPEEPQWKAVKDLFDRTLKTDNLNETLQRKITAGNVDQVLSTYVDYYKNLLTLTKGKIEAGDAEVLDRIANHVDFAAAARLFGVEVPAGGISSSNPQAAVALIDNLLTAIDQSAGSDKLTTVANLLASKCGPRDSAVIAQYLSLFESERLVFGAVSFGNHPQVVTREVVSVDMGEDTAVTVSGYRYKNVSSDDQLLSLLGQILTQRGLITTNTRDNVLAYIRENGGVLDAALVSTIANASSNAGASFVSSDVNVNLDEELVFYAKFDEETGAYSYTVFRGGEQVYEVQEGAASGYPEDETLHGLLVLLERAGFGGLSLFEGYYSFYNQYAGRIYGSDMEVTEYDVNLEQSSQFNEYLTDTLNLDDPARELAVVDLAEQVHTLVMDAAGDNPEDRLYLLKIISTLVNYAYFAYQREQLGGLQTIVNEAVYILNAMYQNSGGRGITPADLDSYFAVFDKQAPGRDSIRVQAVGAAIGEIVRTRIPAGDQIKSEDLVNAAGMALYGLQNRSNPPAAEIVESEFEELRAQVNINIKMKEKYGRGMQSFMIDNRGAAVLTEVASENMSMIRSDLPLGVVIKHSPLIASADLAGEGVTDPLIFVLSYVIALNDLGVIEVEEELINRLSLFLDGKYQPNQDEVQFLLGLLHAPQDLTCELAVELAFDMIEEAGQQDAVSPAWQRFLNGTDGITVMMDRHGRVAAKPYEPVSPTAIEPTAGVGIYETDVAHLEQLGEKEPIVNFNLLLANSSPESLTAEQYFLLVRAGQPVAYLEAANIQGAIRLFGGHYYMDRPLRYEGYEALTKILDGTVDYQEILANVDSSVEGLDDHALSDEERAVLLKVIDFRKNMGDWKKAVLNREEYHYLQSAVQKIGALATALQGSRNKDASATFSAAATDLNEVLGDISEITSAMRVEDYATLSDFYTRLGQGGFVDRDGNVITKLHSLDPRDYNVADEKFAAGLEILERLLVKGLGGVTYVEEEMPTSFGGKIWHGTVKGMKESTAEQSVSSIFTAMPDGYVQFLKLMFFGGTEEAVQATTVPIQQAEALKDQLTGLTRTVENDESRSILNDVEFQQVQLILGKLQNLRATLLELLDTYNTPENKAVRMLLLGALITTYEIELTSLELYREKEFDAYITRALGADASPEKRLAFIQILQNPDGMVSITRFGSNFDRKAQAGIKWYKKFDKKYQDQMRDLHLAKDDYALEKGQLFRYMTSTELDLDLWESMCEALPGMFQANFDVANEVSKMSMAVKDEHDREIHNGEEMMAFIDRVFRSQGTDPRWFDANPSVSDPADVRQAKQCLVLAVSLLPFEKSTANPTNATINTVASFAERNPVVHHGLKRIPILRHIPLVISTGVVEYAITGRFANIEVGADNLEEFQALVNDPVKRNALQAAQFGSSLSRPMSFNAMSVANIANMVFNFEPITVDMLEGDLFANYRTIDYKVVDNAIRALKKSRSDVLTDSRVGSDGLTPSERLIEKHEENLILIDYVDEANYEQAIACLEALSTYMQENDVRIELLDPYHSVDFFEILEESLPEGHSVPEPSSEVRLGAMRLSQFVLDYSMLNSVVLYPDRPASEMDEVAYHDPSQVMRRFHVDGDKITIIRQDPNGVELMIAYERTPFIRRQSKNAYELIGEGTRGAGQTVSHAFYNPQVGEEEGTVAGVSAAVKELLWVWHKESMLEGFNFGYIIPVHIFSGFVNDTIEALTTVEHLALGAYEKHIAGDDLGAQIQMEQAEQVWNSFVQNITHTYGSFLAFEMNPAVILSQFFYYIFEAKDLGRAIGSGMVVIPFSMHIAMKYFRIGRNVTNVGLGNRIGRTQWNSYGLAAFPVGITHNLAAAGQECADFVRTEKAADIIVDKAKVDGILPQDGTLADLSSKQIHDIYSRHWLEIMRECNFNSGLDFDVKIGEDGRPEVVMDERTKNRLADQVVQRDPMGNPVEDPTKLTPEEVVQRINNRNLEIILGNINQIAILGDINYPRALRAAEIVLRYAEAAYPELARDAKGNPKKVTVADLSPEQFETLYNQNEAEILRDCFSGMEATEARRVTFRHLERMRANPDSVSRGRFYRLADSTIGWVGRKARKGIGTAELAHQNVVSGLNRGYTDTAYRVTGPLSRGYGKSHARLGYSPTFRAFQAYQSIITGHPILGYKHLAGMLDARKTRALLNDMANATEQSYRAELGDRGFSAEAIDVAVADMRSNFMSITEVGQVVQQYRSAVYTQVVIEEVSRITGMEIPQNMTLQQLMAEFPQATQAAMKQKSVKAELKKINKESYSKVLENYRNMIGNEARVMAGALDPQGNVVDQLREIRENGLPQEALDRVAFEELGRRLSERGVGRVEIGQSINTDIIQGLENLAEQYKQAVLDPINEQLRARGVAGEFGSILRVDKAAGNISIERPLYYTEGGKFYQATIDSDTGQVNIDKSVEFNSLKHLADHLFGDRSVTVAGEAADKLAEIVTETTPAPEPTRNPAEIARAELSGRGIEVGEINSFFDRATPEQISRFAELLERSGIKYFEVERGARYRFSIDRIEKSLTGMSRLGGNAGIVMRMRVNGKVDKFVYVESNGEFYSGKIKGGRIHYNQGTYVESLGDFATAAFRGEGWIQSNDAGYVGVRGRLPAAEQVTGTQITDARQLKLEAYKNRTHRQFGSEAAQELVRILEEAPLLEIDAKAGEFIARLELAKQAQRPNVERRAGVEITHISSDGTVTSGNAVVAREEAIVEQRAAEERARAEQAEQRRQLDAERRASGEQAVTLRIGANGAPIQVTQSSRGLAMDAEITLRPGESIRLGEYLRNTHGAGVAELIARQAESLTPERLRQIDARLSEGIARMTDAELAKLFETEISKVPEIREKVNRATTARAGVGVASLIISLGGLLVFERILHHACPEINPALSFSLIMVTLHPVNKLTGSALEGLMLRSGSPVLQTLRDLTKLRGWSDLLHLGKMFRSGTLAVTGFNFAADMLGIENEAFLAYGSFAAFVAPDLYMLGANWAQKRFGLCLVPNAGAVAAGRALGTFTLVHFLAGLGGLGYEHLMDDVYDRAVTAHAQAMYEDWEVIRNPQTFVEYMAHWSNRTAGWLGSQNLTKFASSAQFRPVVEQMYEEQATAIDSLILATFGPAMAQAYAQDHNLTHADKVAAIKGVVESIHNDPAQREIFKEWQAFAKIYKKAGVRDMEMPDELINLNLDDADAVAAFDPSMDFVNAVGSRGIVVMNNGGKIEDVRVFEFKKTQRMVEVIVETRMGIYEVQPGDVSKGFVDSEGNVRRESIYYGKALQMLNGSLDEEQFGAVLRLDDIRDYKLERDFMILFSDLDQHSMALYDLAVLLFDKGYSTLDAELQISPELVRDAVLELLSDVENGVFGQSFSRGHIPLVTVDGGVNAELIEFIQSLPNREIAAE
ncbi:MAG: hypothetical protein KKB81_00425 [Candidatus Margulisbacteria bacterium]|nr:hypothetical protein [Candidatus Margulisiibacteriota bacterium]MBU1022421.1 hypothetical protein [Candidatus Margulisiibacteriota bacterium]